MAIKEILLSEAVIPPGGYIIIESGSNKSCVNLDGMQELSNHYDARIICVFGIALHGKWKVDHVGG